MPARPEDIGDALADGARDVCHGYPTEVRAQKGGANKVIAQRTQPGEPDESGRRKPVPVPDEFFELEADLILMATGESPGTDTDMGVSLKLDGSVSVDPETGATSRAGVFSAGDVAGARRTVLDAIASGRRAGFGIDAYLSGDGQSVAPLDFLTEQVEDATVDSARGGGEVPSPPGGYREVEYQSPRGTYSAIEGVSPERPSGFSRTTEPLTEAQAREVASRCLLCGACGECSACLELFGCPAMYVEDGKVAIDSTLCTGCGVCALFCPNGAIVEVPLT
jgi:Pyruvate/2-oxoacid:ferredoxin oxidoreductase delta subunit